MSLAPGTRLGAYEILALVGAGGMGEVYRARDTRLDRTVAIKVLPPTLAADSDLRERFDREARAMSSLAHAHICALFDVGHQDGVDFIVLEYLEGETIAGRLTRAGALPPAEALAVAIDICDALDKAHRAGIVHRDLKPANVMLTRSGAKLLDFGLAKRAAPVLAGGAFSTLPTTPPNVTAQGTILGTFQYMAPEQIEGLDSDARTDVFAFGALLFAMLTGRPAFEGKTRASLLGAILKDEPPRVSATQPKVPAALDRIIATCLDKDPDDRYQSARDLLRDLKWAAADATPLSATATRSGSRSRSTAVAWSVAALMLAALVGIGWLAFRQRSTPARALQFTIPVPENASFATPPGGGTGFTPQVAVSPNGQYLVFVAMSQSKFQLWLRPLASDAARPIPGSEGASFPFWSPDSRNVGFFAGGKLKRVAIAGGLPIVLCDAPSGRGGTWNTDDIIVFGGVVRGLQRVAAAGGVPQDASVLDSAYGETSHRFPWFLPDGRHFLYTGTVGTCCPAAKPARIRIGSLESMNAITLMEAESSVAFVSDHLFYNRDGILMAQPFDADSREIAGEPFPVIDHLASEGSRYGSFSVSPAGVLVSASGLSRPLTRVVWMDRSGRDLGGASDPAPHQSLTLSPDERRAATVLMGEPSGSSDVWILEVPRAGQRLTFTPGSDSGPIWSPDGRSVIFQTQEQNGQSLKRIVVGDTTAKEETLLTSRYALVPNDWSADGRYIVYSQNQGTGLADIWALPLSGDRTPIPLVQTSSVDQNGTLSPNGRWLAYQSGEAGSPQIYVQPFPVTGRQVQISIEGGTLPVWRPDGKELFFLSLDSRLMAVAVDASLTFQHGDPEPLFSLATNSGSVNRQYGVSKDGQKFLVNRHAHESRTRPLNVIVNWLASIQK